MFSFRHSSVMSHGLLQHAFVCLGLLAALCAAAPAHGQARIVLNAGTTIKTLAGNGEDGQTQNGNAAAVALGNPRGLVYDSSGNLYVTDSRNHQVNKVSADGTLAVVAGTGQEGFSGDAGLATSALLSHPSALALRPDGTLLIADTGNHRIRSVSPGGIISTVAGIGTSGNAGDGGPATSAQLRSPAGIALDSANNLLVADTGNHRIRRIKPSGTITAMAGTGTEGDEGDGGPASAAAFRSPGALLTLSDGRILVADTAARRVRALLPNGTVVAYAAGTTLRRPEGLAVGPTGDTLLADAGLQQLLQSTPTGMGAVVGSGSQGPVTQGSAVASTLDSPAAAATAPDGSITIADRRNHQVQRITLPIMAFGAIPTGQQSNAQQLTVANGGDSALQITAITLPAGFATDGSGSCRALPLQLTAGTQCTVGILFRPQAQGLATGTALVVSDVAPTAAVRLTGTAIPPTALTASTTSMTTNGTIAYTGAPVLLSASVFGTLPSAPAGNVTFTDNTVTLSTVPLAAAAASLSTNALTAGQHTLQASYSGDAHYAPSNSAPTVVTVVSTPDFTLSASASSYSGKTSSTITVPLTCLPKSGTLNRPINLSFSGMPTGFAGSFAPPTVALAADPATSTLTITVPATVASQRHASVLVITTALLLLPCCWRRSRQNAALALTACIVGLCGCGGGFRTASTPVNSSTTHSYNLTVTATATGVLGETLTHSIPVELVITP